MALKIIGLLLLGLSLCYSKRSHHKHRLKKTNALPDLGSAKSVVAHQPKLDLVSNGTKKQSLGMPFNNLDQQGLGGEPVGHIHDVHDASEGVGGLGGDADGVPIGMGAGAEPLGMSKGKEMHGINGMDDHGGAMQGLNEESEAMHGGNEDVTRPFNEEQEGDFDAGHGGKGMMSEQSNGYMPSSGGSNPMSMMGSSHGGHGGGSMGNFMGGGGGGGGDGNEGMSNGGGNFMEPSDDDSSFKGPKRDPLGGDIKPFNDEFKNDDGSHGGHNLMMNGPEGMSRGSMSQGGMSRFSPMSDDSNGNGGDQQFHHHHTRQHTIEDLPQGLNGNLASLDKVNAQGDGEMGNNAGPENKVSGSPTLEYINEQRGRRPSDISVEEKGKPMVEIQKNNEGMLTGHEMETELSALQQDGDMSSKEGLNRDYLASSNFPNPSTAEISKALSGNPSDLSSVNIQGDNEIAEMVRKATHQKEQFASRDSQDAVNGAALMEPGYTSTTRQFAGHELKEGGHSKLAHTKNTVAHRKRPRTKNLQ